jgi:hypothetical protein
MLTPFVLVALFAMAPPPAPRAHPVGPTFAAAGRKAMATLLYRFYAGNGSWRACASPRCPTGNVDWGYDSLTYTLALRADDSYDTRVRPRLKALAASARTYPAPCDQVSTPCPFWSDVPEWDAVALADEYLLTGDPVALAKAQAAFEFVAGSSVFALGACPSIPYQKPGGGENHLKTLETEANAVKAALLLYRATHNQAYLASALAGYRAVRTYFLDPQVPLYSVYVFDDGQSCTQLPHRYFASVNGDMIWSGVELYKDTGDNTYLLQAIKTANSVQTYLSDSRGVFANLQAENDVVEPLVEGMYALAVRNHRLPRHWLLTNAAAALSARVKDGSFGRFFDGPPPATTVTAWQTNGGLALEIAAANIAPNQVIDGSPRRWAAATFVRHPIAALPATLRFRGSGIAVLGTLGEQCCEGGHARVLVDGHETFDRSGIWQNKSSSHMTIPGTILFSWRWRTAGRHTLTFLPGADNAKEGQSFLHLVGYRLLRG